MFTSSNDALSKALESESSLKKVLSGKYLLINYVGKMSLQLNAHQLTVESSLAGCCLSIFYWISDIQDKCHYSANTIENESIFKLQIVRKMHGFMRLIKLFSENCSNHKCVFKFLTLFQVEVQQSILE